MTGRLSLRQLKQTEEQDKLFGTEAEARARMPEPAGKSRSKATDYDEALWSDEATELEEEEQFFADEVEQELSAYGRTFSEERLVRDSITRFFSRTRQA